MLEQSSLCSQTQKDLSDEEEDGDLGSWEGTLSLILRWDLWSEGGIIECPEMFGDSRA